MLWKIQELVWVFFPADRDVKFTASTLSVALVLLALASVLAWHLNRKVSLRVMCGLMASLLLCWAGMYLARPPWLRIAMHDTVPTPTMDVLQWTQRAPGFETAETDLRVGEQVVDHLVLVRMDPARYQLSVNWDPAGSRKAENWQQDMQAAVVVNGSYFGQDFAPLTPLRMQGKNAGPSPYDSSHGALVINGSAVDIIDLRGRDVHKTIAAWPDAMVSYPLLIDPQGKNRATENKHWLAARNFVAIDHAGRVVLGTTETGFFTIYRLGEFLRQAPLDLRVALNLDGGPLVSQVVQVGDFSRRFHGKAEISNGYDFLRTYWHLYTGAHWTLPIVLMAKEN